MNSFAVFDMRSALRHIADRVATGMGTDQDAAQLRQFEEQLKDLQSELIEVVQMRTVILRFLTTQAEWACACVAVSNFRHDESGKVGRRYGMTYTLDAPGEPDITLEVWRSQRGIEVRRVNKIEDEVRHEIAGSV